MNCFCLSGPKSVQRVPYILFCRLKDTFMSRSMIVLEHSLSLPGKTDTSTHPHIFLSSHSSLVYGHKSIKCQGFFSHIAQNSASKLPFTDNTHKITILLKTFF